MDTIRNSEKKIDDLLKHKKDAGFTNPPAGYFDDFVSNLPLQQQSKVKTRKLFPEMKSWLRFTSYAVAAVLLLALFVLAFEANINKTNSTEFTVDDLLAINDFQNYDDDLIYSELVATSADQSLVSDDEVDALMNMESLSTDEIIDLYSADK